MLNYFLFFRDGSDEMGCQPKPPLPLCKPNEYSCFNGWECISKSLYCDGTFHCSDRSDETNCPTLGGFQLLDLIITGLKTHMTC